MTVTTKYWVVSKNLRQQKIITNNNDNKQENSMTMVTRSSVVYGLGPVYQRKLFDTNSCVPETPTRTECTRGQHFRDRHSLSWRIKTTSSVGEVVLDRHLTKRYYLHRTLADTREGGSEWRSKCWGRSRGRYWKKRVTFQERQQRPDMSWPGIWYRMQYQYPPLRFLGLQYPLPLRYRFQYLPPPKPKFDVNMT